jgi:hypothetical protein
MGRQTSHRRHDEYGGNGEHFRYVAHRLLLSAQFNVELAGM